jgi:aromatic-amino-acid transaminase
MFFNDVLEAPSDPVFGLTGAFKADPRPNKVDLLVGIYKDEKLKADLLPSVIEAKKKMGELAAEYRPFDGQVRV